MTLKTTPSTSPYTHMHLMRVLFCLLILISTSARAVEQCEIPALYEVSIGSSDGFLDDNPICQGTIDAIYECLNLVIIFSKSQASGSGVIAITEIAQAPESNNPYRFNISYIQLDTSTNPNTERDRTGFIEIRINERFCETGYTKEVIDNFNLGLEHAVVCVPEGSNQCLPPEAPSHDSDGDGIADHIEIKLGSNPYDTSITLGDINQNGEINLGDYLLLEQFVLGARTPTSGEETQADLNKDDQLGLQDMLILKKCLLGIDFATGI